MDENRKRQIRILRTEVVFGLGLKGHSLKSLATANGVKASTIRKALYSSFPRGEKIIASAMGIEPSILWPDRYTKDGAPIKRGPQKSKPINIMPSPDVKGKILKGWEGENG